MTWHCLDQFASSLFSPAPAEASSDPSSSAIESSAPSSGSPSVAKCFSDDSGTACCPCSRSGITSAPSTADPGVARWISSLADSPASPSAPPASDAARRMNETCGPKPRGSFARWNPRSSSWRTYQISLLTGTLGEYSATWPRAGSMRSGIAFQRQPLAPLTRGIGSGSSPYAEDYPTPTASSYGSSGNGDGNNRASRGRPSLETMARRGLLPTPTKSDALAQANSVTAARRIDAARRLPTPVKSDSEGGSYLDPPTSRPSGGGMMLKEVVRGPLNPALHLWLMGWPTEWNALPRLEMGKFRSWLRSHSAALSRLF